MRKPLNDRQRLGHILKTANRLVSEYDLLADMPTEDGDIRYWAFVKLVKIVGEESYNLSSELKA